MYLQVIERMMECFDPNLPVSALREMSQIFRNLCRIDDKEEPLYKNIIKRMLITLTRLADHSDFEVSCGIYVVSCKVVMHFIFIA